MSLNKNKQKKIYKKIITHVLCMYIIDTEIVFYTQKYLCFKTKRERDENIIIKK